jgi:hypothetical protein
MTTHADLHRYSPLTSVDWRWRRAQRLVEHRQARSRLRDDAATRRAASYVRDLARYGGLSPKLAGKHPQIWAAHRLRQSDGPARLVVEARILARQTSDAIAQLTGIDADVVDAFEAVFFSVRDHIDARDWVAAQAIYRGPGGQTESRAGAGLKVFAYLGGPSVLDAVIPYLVEGKELFDASLDLSTQAGLDEQAVRLAVAAHLLPDDPATNAKLSRIMLMMRERQAHRPVPPPPLVQVVDLMLTEGWDVAAPKRQAPLAPTLAGPPRRRQTA